MGIQVAKLINELLDQGYLFKLSTGNLTIALHIHWSIKILARLKILKGICCVPVDQYIRSQHRDGFIPQPTFNHLIFRIYSVHRDLLLSGEILGLAKSCAVTKTMPE
jgi:hypothetical protein